MRVDEIEKVLIGEIFLRSLLRRLYLFYTLILSASIKFYRICLSCCIEFEHTIPFLLLSNLKLSPFRCWYYQKSFRSIFFAQGMANFLAVFIRDVVIGFVLIFFKKILFDLSIVVCQLPVQTYFFLLHLFELSFHVGNLTLYLRVFISSNPFYRILMHFLNIINPLEHVCDIVYTPFLYSQLCDCFIQIYSAVITVFYEFDELFGKYC